MAQDMNGKELSTGDVVLVPCKVTEVPDDHSHIRITPQGFKFDSIRGDFVIDSESVQAQPKPRAGSEPGAKATAAAKNRTGPTQEEQEAATQAKGPKAQEARGQKVNDVNASQRAAKATADYTGTGPTTTDDVKGGGADHPKKATKKAAPKKSRARGKATK
jgi:hypothetical protein